MSAALFAALALCVSLSPPAVDALALPQVFGSHMVLQRAPLRAKIWGEARPHSSVTCTLDEDAGLEVQADAAGRFVCELQPHPLSWNHTVTVADDEQTVVLSDVAFGDVVLCLGQSNMELSLNYTLGGAEAIADSVHHPSIRLFTVAWHKSATPLNDTANRWSGGSWRVASPEAVDCGPGCGFGYFASTCYYYGLAIDVALQGRVPLGLMQVTYGGTWVEEWTRAEVVAQCGAVPHNNATTGQIWNAMVAPVVNITTQLTLWYQGETNTDSSEDALHYGCAFRAMISDLRRHQRGAASPFYFVLLAPAHNGTQRLVQGWQSQLMALSLPNTAIANAIDLGDVSPLMTEFHPRNKSYIGQRLARIALNHLYGQTQVTRGPTLNASADVRVERLDGSQLRVTLVYPPTAENSMLHVMGTAECSSCCDGVSSALFGVSVVDGAHGGGGESGGTVHWPPHVDIDVEHHTLQAVLSVPNAISRVRLHFENAVSYPECALYNEANLPSLPFSVEVDVSDVPLLVHRLPGMAAHSVQQ